MRTPVTTSGSNVWYTAGTGGGGGAGNNSGAIASYGAVFGFCI